MVARITLSLGVLLMSAALQAAAANYAFRGMAQVDGGDTLVFEVDMAPGEVRFIDLDENLKLELSTAASGDYSPATQVRVLRREGKSYRLLHTADTDSGADVQRSYGYHICGDQVRFTSPAPASLPDCN
ncbi:hypothetical protein [Microbulbifer hainanensis]|uniref:hypothetical protein n=1 Tax=Microbulbifer hainanensis TaxID=2735675 RepID=UPI001865AD45|nr:hypothetical protein [Microbulbifer hainanensis]